MLKNILCSNSIFKEKLDYTHVEPAYYTEEMIINMLLCVIGYPCHASEKSGPLQLQHTHTARRRENRIRKQIFVAVSPKRKTGRVRTLNEAFYYDSFAAG